MLVTRLTQCITFAYRAHQVPRVVQAHMVFRDRQESLVALVPEDKMEEKECRELMDCLESKEIMGQR